MSSLRSDARLLKPPQLHLETEHPEDGQSPFVVKDDASIAALMSLDGGQNERYANCPVEGCGEAILLTELDSHIEMHEEEQDSGDAQSSRSSKRIKLEPEIEAAFDTKLSHALRNLEDVNEREVSETPSSDRQEVTKAAWKSILKMPDSPAKLPTTSTSKSTRRRLGVSLPILILNGPWSRGAYILVEIRTRPSCTREADAIMVSQTAPRTRRCV